MNINSFIKEMVRIKKHYEARHIPLHRVHVGFTIERTDNTDEFCIFDKQNICTIEYGNGDLDVPGGTYYNVCLMRFTSDLTSEEAIAMKETEDANG